MTIRVSDSRDSFLFAAHGSVSIQSLSQLREGCADIFCWSSYADAEVVWHAEEEAGDYAGFKLLVEQLAQRSDIALLQPGKDNGAVFGPVTIQIVA